MKLRVFFTKAEILFWTASVGLMKNQRSVRMIAAGILVILVVAILALLFVPDKDEEISASPPPILESTPLPAVHQKISPDLPVFAHGQSNLLVILVETLESEEPELIGIWLVERVESMPQIVFLPLYPNDRPEEMELYQRIFELDAGGRPSTSLLDYLRSKKVWWDHYLVADKSSLSDLVVLAGGVDWDGRTSAGSELVASLPDGDAPHEVRLSAQARIALVLCQNAPELIRNANPEIIWGLLTHRMRSDLDLASIKVAQQQISKPGGNPVCQFPTLQKTTFTIQTQ